MSLWRKLTQRLRPERRPPYAGAFADERAHAQDVAEPQLGPVSTPALSPELLDVGSSERVAFSDAQDGVAPSQCDRSADEDTALALETALRSSVIAAGPVAAAAQAHLAQRVDLQNATDQAGALATPAAPLAELQLGTEPSDPLIADLVALNETSVRLENAIRVADSRGELPFKCLSEYLAAGDQAQALMMRYVENLGRKSAAELDLLVHQAVPQLAPRQPGTGPAVALSIVDLRSSLAELFAGTTVREALAHFDAPARVLGVLERTGHADGPLSRLLSEYVELSPQLLAMQNMGRTSLGALREILGAIVRSGLEARGFDGEDVAAAEFALLDTSAPDFRDRRQLTERLSEIAERLDSEPQSSKAEEAEAAPAEPPPEPPPPKIEPYLREALDQLDSRPRDIVERRYGLTDVGFQTLEEVGRLYDVTRERIRQIEHKTLRQLRHRTLRRLSRSVMVYGDDAWSALSQGQDYVLAREVGERRQNLSRWFVLALELCQLSPEAWLDRWAQPFERGWVSPSAPLDELHNLRARLEDRLQATTLPCALATLASEGERAYAAAVLALTDRRLFGGYVTGEAPRVRMRRALRLHAMLAEGGEPVQVVELVERYRQITPHDLCSARDAEIVMQTNKHLFIELEEGTWASLGPGGETPVLSEGIAPEDPEPVEETQLETLGADDQQTVVEAVAAELGRVGPTRISDLIDRAQDFLPPGRSANSVGPTLITNKDRFARPLPGFYALHDQVPAAERVKRAPPAFLMQEDQVRLYVLARRAGEPWGTYPLWIPETERAWCLWARRNADTDLFESLLSIVQPQTWAEGSDLHEWLELARTRGRFSIQYPPSSGAFVLPDLDRVLAGALHIRQCGGMGWVSANRMLMRRASEHLSAGLLAVLVGLEILAADAPDWQAPHPKGGRLEERLDALEAGRLMSGDLEWDTDLGERLKAEVLAFVPTSGWVTAELLHELFDTPAPAPEPPAGLSPLEMLLSEQDDRARSAEREAALRALVGPGGRA